MAALLLQILILLAFVGLPITLVLAWWFWSRRLFPSTKWRNFLTLSGLLTASFNLLLYLGVYHFVWQKFIYSVTTYWKMSHAFGAIGFALLFWSFLGGVIAQGQLRRLLILHCLLGMLFWFPKMM